jgi:cobalamin biosynthesis protein CobD/CbiB
VEYIDKLNKIGLYFETAIADQPAAEQPVVTMKRVVECLKQIGQRELAGILVKQSQGKIFQKNK